MRQTRCTFNSLLQYYDGEADMPGGLSRADYAADRWQSTRLKIASGDDVSLLASAISSSRMHSTSSTFRASIPIRCARLSGAKEAHHAFPREYWVRGIEPRYSQSFMLGASAHEVGVGYRYVNESTHEMRYYTPPSAARVARHRQSGTTAIPALAPGSRPVYRRSY